MCLLTPTPVSVVTWDASIVAVPSLSAFSDWPLAAPVFDVVSLVKTFLGVDVLCLLVYVFFPCL